MKKKNEKPTKQLLNGHGTNLLKSRKQDKKIICPRCGKTSHRQIAKFCSHCGAELYPGSGNQY